MRISGFLLAVLFSLGVHARAGVIYQTGFEPPTYTTGQLQGQDGWFNSTVPVVETTTVHSGAQAAAFSAVGLVGQNTARHALSYDSGSDPNGVVQLQAWAFLSGTGTLSRWDIFAAIGDGGFLAQLLVIGNTARLGTAGFTGNTIVPLAAWNQFNLDLDFHSQLATAYVNGQLIGQSSFAGTTQHTLTEFAYGMNSLPGTDQLFLDDLSITSAVPEPASVILLLTAVPLVWQRRKLSRMIKTRPAVD